MRTHEQIVRDVKPPEALAELCSVSPHTVRSWILRDSIPSEFWARIVAQDLATLDELAMSAETGAAKRQAKREAERQAA